MARFVIQNPLVRRQRQVNTNDTVVYERPTPHEPVGRFMAEPESLTLRRQRSRSYWRALGCVAVAAMSVLMLVLGVPDHQSTGIKFLLGFGFVAFTVLSVHYVIAAVTAYENDNDFTPGQSRRF